MHCNLAIVQPHQCCHHHRCHSHHHQHHHGRYDLPHQLHLVFRVIAESPNGNFLSFLQPQPFLWSLSLFKNCRVSERFPCLFRHRKCHFRSYLVLTTETFEPLSPWASVYTVSGKKLPATTTPWSTSHSALSSRVRWRNTSHRHCPEPPMSLADNAKFKSVGNWAPGKDHTMKKAQRRRCKCYTDNVHRAKKCKTDQGNSICTVLKSVRQPEATILPWTKS